MPKCLDPSADTPRDADGRSAAPFYPSAAGRTFPYRHRTLRQIEQGYRVCPDCEAMTRWPCSWGGCSLVTDPIDIAVRRAWLRLNRQAAPPRRPGVRMLERAMLREVEEIDR